MACYFLNDSSKQSNAAGKFTRWLQSKKQTRILTCCFPQIPSYHYKKERHLPWPMPLWKEQMVGKYYGNRQNITVAAGNVFFSLFFSIFFFSRLTTCIWKPQNKLWLDEKMFKLLFSSCIPKKLGFFFFFSWHWCTSATCVSVLNTCIIWEGCWLSHRERQPLQNTQKEVYRCMEETDEVEEETGKSDGKDKEGFIFQRSRAKARSR